MDDWPTTADVIAWFKDEKQRREAAETRIAALEDDLRVAAALLLKLRLLVAWADVPNRLDVLEAIDAVLSRPGVVTLWEEVRP
jgi:hypothetical protein